MEAATTPRTSLTKKQLGTEAGLELLSICQSITADGRVADEEIHALRAWIERNRAAELPAVEFLAATLERVLADGVITAEERLSVAKAVEAVLPPAERKFAGLLRRQVEREDKAAAKTAVAAEKAASKAEKAKLKPLFRADFMVAGTRHDGRAEIIEDEVQAGEPAFLLREPGNKHSRRATKVLTESGSCVGYVPEEFAQDIAPLLDRGCTHSARFKKVLGYGSGPVPVVLAEIFDEAAPAAGAASQADAAALEEQAARRLVKTFLVGLAFPALLVGLVVYWISS